MVAQEGKRAYGHVAVARMHARARCEARVSAHGRIAPLRSVDRKLGPRSHTTSHVGERRCAEPDEDVSAVRRVQLPHATVVRGVGVQTCFQIAESPHTFYFT